MKSFFLPMPPSSNGLFRNTTAGDREVARKQGRTCPPRVKTSRYKAWIEQAGLALLAQGLREPTPGWVRLTILLHAPRPEGRFDTDNVKAVADLLTRHGLIEDDSLIADLRVCWTAMAQRGLTVTVAADENPWELPEMPHAESA